MWVFARVSMRWVYMGACLHVWMSVCIVRKSAVCICGWLLCVCMLVGVSGVLRVEGACV